MGRSSYFTKERKAKMNPDSLKKYEKYKRSNVIKNKEVEGTTYSVYQNNFEQFLVFLAENWDNIDLYSDEFFENAIDIIEEFMAFCQDTLGNGKKTINNKMAAISTFYHWSVKRRYIDYHPFDKRVDRMKGASEEKIYNSYFLKPEEVEKINEVLKERKDFDIQDEILWHLAIDSANRIGAISKVLRSKMDLDECMFVDIREKRGYRVEVAFEEYTRDLIEEWLMMRTDNYDKLECDGLFIRMYDKEWGIMGKGSLQRRLNKIGKIIGLEDFHAHCTRKTTLNNIVEETGDITLAAELGNHKSIETTRSAYLKKKTKSEVRDRIKELKNKKSNNTNN